MKADPTDTLAVLRELVAHAGKRAMPTGWALRRNKEHPLQHYLNDPAPESINQQDARDLCVGLWMRRLKPLKLWVMCFDRTAIYTARTRNPIVRTEGNGPFVAIAKLILALPKATARAVFARGGAE